MWGGAAMIAAVKRIELWVRKRLPASVRHVLRLGQHLVSRDQKSLAIPPELLVDCRVCASRYELVKLLPKGRVAEIGTNQGRFARHILAHCDPTELHLIDLEFSRFDAKLAQDRRVTVHKGLSHEVLASFPAASFDWIYIDADHSYAAVARDARAAADKVKPEGFLVFNDFAHIDPYLGTYGVHRAVVEFAVKERWRFVWLAYEPHALYDVVLQRAVTD
jgi:SAM-dependent methyltransferase